MNKKLSFVIPTYNSSAWLCHAVESAQKQDYANLEIVVVDDGSADSTQKVMEFMAEKDARINYIRLPKNFGRSEARNIGNKAASGDYIAVLDADDVAYPNRAKLTVDKLRNSDFVQGSCDIIDAIGNLVGGHEAQEFDKDRAFTKKLNYIVHSTCAYTKELAMKYPYRSGQSSQLGLDDWQFQLEVAMSGAKMSTISTAIGAYRDMESGVSKTRDAKEVEAYKTSFLEALKVTH